MNRAFAAVCLSVCILFTASCAKKVIYQTEVLFAMGTVVDITLPSADAECFSKLNLFINGLSDEITEDCKKISENTGFVEINEFTYRLIERGRTFNIISGARFEPAVATITKLYGFPEGEWHIPPSEELDAAKQLLRTRSIDLKEEGGHYFAAGNGLSVELGAYAKGWIVDQASAYLLENGIQNFIINAAGDLYASGMKSGDTKWRLGIKDPNGILPYVSAVMLHDKALATSGIYERFFITEDGVRISHLFDATTGETVNRYKSVSVIADTAETADVLSTVYFLVEPEDLPALCRKYDTPVLVIGLDDTKKMYCEWGGYE